MSSLDAASVHSVSPAPCWDPWILWDGAGYRLFYLSGRTDREPWWRTSWICGAYSTDWPTSRANDLPDWTHTGPLLEPFPTKDSEKGWESGRIFAGSAYQDNHLYYLFYSAASEADITEEAIGLATSTDGTHWQRSEQPLLSWVAAANIESDTGVGYAGRCNFAGHLHWRDPYIVESIGELTAQFSDELTNTETQPKKYYLFFCTSLTSHHRYQGGLGVAVASQLGGPYQLLPPAAGPGIGSSVDLLGNLLPVDEALWPFYHLERPQVILFQGCYHLFFSCFKEAINPLWLAQIGPDNVSDSTLYWYVADCITGPFYPTGDLPVVPGSEQTGLYGTTFYPITFRGDWSKVALFDGQSDSGTGGENEAGLEMAVLGWYHQDYRLAIAQEFSAIWRKDGLKIIANSDR